MGKLTSRPARQLVGPLLGALGAIAWAVHRRQLARGQPPQGIQPSIPVEPPGMPPDPQPLTIPRTTTRPGVQTILGTAVSIGIAGTVALTLAVFGIGAWWLPLAVAGGLLLLSGCVFLFPRLFAPSRPPEDVADLSKLVPKDRIQFADDRRKLQNEIRTALVQAVGGGAVLVGLLFTWHQQQATSRQVADQLAVTRQGQIGERFSRAVGQLGNGSIDVRLGGLYELEQLSRPQANAPERRRVIIEVVAAYIREHAPPPASPKGQQLARHPKQDVAAALTILSRRSIEPGDPPADLRRVNFARMILVQANLDRVDLRAANLRFANLTEATLRGANLRGANLRDANLNHAILSGADLRRADLNSKSLDRTDLSGADLRFADLSGADLRTTNLKDAIANRDTHWPAGFKPGRAGVKEVQ